MTIRSQARCRPPTWQYGPGTTGRSYSAFATILDSVSRWLGILPGDTATIGNEIVHYDQWVTRGHR